MLGGIVLAVCIGLPLCFPNKIQKRAPVPGRFILQKPRIYKPSAACQIPDWVACHKYQPPYGPNLAPRRLTFQPTGCDLPEVQPRALLKKLRGRTLFFMGDSVMRQQYYMLLCELGQENAFSDAFSTNIMESLVESYRATGKGLDPTNQMYCRHMRLYNVTVCYKKIKNVVLDTCFGFEEKCGKSQRRCCWRHLLSMRRHFKPDDLVVLNMGLHYRIKDYPMYLRETLEAFGDLGCKAPGLVYREITPQFFPTKDGDYDPSVQNKSGTSPMACGGQPFLGRAKLEGPLLRKFNTSVLHVTDHLANDLSYPEIFRKIGMPGRHARERKQKLVDCTHWCAPGVPNHMNRLLYSYIMSDVWTLEQRGCKR